MSNEATIQNLYGQVAALTERWKARNILLLEVSGRGDMLKKEHVNPDALDGLVAVQNEFDRLRNIVIRDLDLRAAALTRERDSLREALGNLRMGDKDAGGCWCIESPTRTSQPDWKHTKECKAATAALATPEENQ